MRYVEKGIYHIYNRGHNGDSIFPQQRNYRFFEGKLIDYLTPIADVLAYCLMPKHFHLLVQVRAEGAAPSRRAGFNGKQQNMSQAIGKLMSSYSRAINNQENRKGSLFMGRTQVVSCWYEGCETVDKVVAQHKSRHAAACLDYIHCYPVKGNLCEEVVDWPYSSASFYAREEDNILARVKLAKDLSLF